MKVKGRGKWGSVKFKGCAFSIRSANKGPRSILQTKGAKTFWGAKHATKPGAGRFCIILVISSNKVTPSFYSIYLLISTVARG